MNKNNKKILGVPMAMFVIGILIIGGASAALVSYLSNSVEVDIEVSSPISLEMAEIEHGMTILSAIENVANENVDWQETVGNLSTTGLSTMELGLKVENNADVDIMNEYLEFELSNENNNATCDDLTSLTFIDVGCSEGTWCYQEQQELVGTVDCNEFNGSAYYSIPITLWESGLEYNYPVTLTFANVEPGMYGFDATAVMSE